VNEYMVGSDVLTTN